MEEFLYKKWLEENAGKLHRMLLHNGINGLLFNFETWLKKNYYLKVENGKVLDHKLSPLKKAVRKVRGEPPSKSYPYPY